MKKMKKEGDLKEHSKISHTAVVCAKALAKDAGIPYAKSIYKKLTKYKSEIVKQGTEGIFLGAIKRIVYSNPKFAGLKTQLEGRYRAINRALEKEKNPYVIEIASGLSPRGLSFTRGDSKRIYIETDLPELLKIKKEIVNNIRKEEKSSGLSPTPNYHLLPANILNRKQLIKAAEIYKKSDRKKPLAIIHSGLFMYLDRKEQEKARDNIAFILKKYSPNGAWITTDLGFDRKKILSANRFAKIMMKRIEKSTGRKFTFFQSKKEVKNFVEEAGFKMKIISSDDLISQLHTVKKYKLDENQVRDKSYMYDVFVMKLG